MPTYEITAPDGEVYEVDAPEGATEAQVMAYAQANYKPKAAAPVSTPAAVDPLTDPLSPESLRAADPLADENPLKVQGAALVNSLRSTGVGLMQAQADARNAVVNNPVTSGVAGAIGLGKQQQALAGATQADSDRLRQEQGEYERVVESRLQNNPTFRRSDTTFDIAQTALPAMRVAGATARAPLLARAATDAAVGGLQAGTTALGEDESRTGETGKGAGLSALGTTAGAAIGRVATGLSDQIRPAVREMYNAVQARGIQPSISGLLDDGALKTTAEFLQALPFAGGARAINRELGEFTNAVGRTFGLNERELSKAAMDRAENALSTQYDATLNGREVMLDTDFVRRAAQIMRNAPQSIDAPQREILNNNVMRLINAAQTGSMPATLYQELRGVLAQNAKRTGAQGVSDHILDLRRALDDAAVRSIGRADPAAAQALMGLNRAWANLTKAEEMLSAGGGKAGIVSPKTAAAATKPSTSATAGPRSTTSMRNLAEAAERTGVGSGSRELPWFKRLGSTVAAPVATGATAALSVPFAATAAVAGPLAGRILNSRAGSRYLAEGLSPSARALAERLGLVARAAPATTTRAKKRKELKK